MNKLKVYIKLQHTLAKLFLAFSAIAIVTAFLFIIFAVPFYALHQLAVYLHRQSELLEKAAQNEPRTWRR